MSEIHVGLEVEPVEAFIDEWPYVKGSHTEKETSAIIIGIVMTRTSPDIVIAGKVHGQIFTVLPPWIKVKYPNIIGQPTNPI